jgi:hypothetical protein
MITYCHNTVQSIKATSDYSQIHAYALYGVIHKTVKHFKNSQQMDYATDHGITYADRERTLKVFFKEKPVQIVALVSR